MHDLQTIACPLEVMHDPVMRNAQHEVVRLHNAMLSDGTCGLGCSITYVFHHMSYAI